MICSPVVEDAAILTNLAKKAKKNGVAVDIVNIGTQENLGILQTFIDAVNNADNSHLVHVEAGVSNVADMVISSPINQVAVVAGGEVNPSAGVGRVDPNMDPELAEAIRQSLEEQKTMLQASNVEVKKEEKKEPAAVEDAFAGLSEEEIMQRAILLSMEGKAEDAKEGQGEVEVPAMQQTMPTGPLGPETAHAMEVKKQEKPVDLEQELLKNQDFVTELIQTLPDMSEAEKMKVLSGLGQKEKEEKKKSEGETKKDAMEDIKPVEKKKEEKKP